MDSFQIYKFSLFVASLLSAVSAQKFGTSQAETHPSLTWQTCSAGGSCTTNNGEVVIDANWRWLHNVGGYTNCFTGNEWSDTYCPTNEDCTANCQLEGASYASTYGVTTSGSALTLKYVTQSAQKNVGSRMYLMEDENTYQMFYLLNQEFTFDVDVSQIGCGINGALYFVSMDADGGMSKYPTNEAGAKYGTGYCDSQCPSDLKFINGQANAEGWIPSPDNPNAGTGAYGSCCAEMDIWEANKISTAFTPHPCDVPGQVRCERETCGGTYSPDRYSGTCDPDGCDFNPFRQGNETFYGPGLTVDTNLPMTVVTQFLTNSAGTLSEIKRFYVQNGKVIPNSESTFAANPGNSITSDFCNAQKTFFGDTDVFNPHGGMAGMGEALEQGMVLVMSIWDDSYSNMLWLDSNYPTDADPEQPGIARGTCPITSGEPDATQAQFPNASVKFSNIKVGPIGSTFNSGGSSSSSTTTTTSRTSTTTSSRTTTTTTTTRTTTTTTAGPTTTGVAQHWQQCGGNGYTGPTVCASPWTCVRQNEWYSQCL